MTSKHKPKTTAKPEPTELKDDALDRVAGGAGSITDLVIDPVNRDTAHPGGANFLFGDGSVRFVK